MPNSANFAINHVGARFGNYPLQVPEQLSQCIDVVLFDADEDCVNGLAGASTERLRVVTACLSDSDGEADFCITVNAPASSLLEPSHESRGYMHMFGIDWDVMAGVRVVERRRVVTARLDTLLGNRPDLPVPDFLSLDTQGSELAILKGGDREAFRAPSDRLARRLRIEYLGEAGEVESPLLQPARDITEPTHALVELDEFHFHNEPDDASTLHRPLGAFAALEQCGKG